MKEYAQRFKNAVMKNKKLSAVLLLAVIGGLLIMLSDGEKEVPVSAEAKYSDSDYCAELESKIKSIVAAITGDKDCIIAVTLETGSEYIYADQQKTDTDLSKDGQNGSTTKESEKTEQEYIIVKSGDGSEQALIVTEKKPTIRGVAIVSGGITDKNEAGILNAVSSVLGISSRKISITNKS